MLPLREFRCKEEDASEASICVRIVFFFFVLLKENTLVVLKGNRSLLDSFSRGLEQMQVKCVVVLM